VAGGFAVVSNPEFLKEGAAVDDFMRPTASSSAPTTSGDPADARAVRAVHAQPRPLVVMDVRSAEFTKYAANAMLATRISFMNELALLAERWAPTSRGAQGHRQRPAHRLPLPLPGTGYGGSASPRT
jgi:UDPglucose 6-dehydrogenase